MFCSINAKKCSCFKSKSQVFCFLFGAKMLLANKYSSRFASFFSFENRIHEMLLYDFSKSMIAHTTIEINCNDIRHVNFDLASSTFPIETTKKKWRIKIRMKWTFDNFLQIAKWNKRQWIYRQIDFWAYTLRNCESNQWKISNKREFFF